MESAWIGEHLILPTSYTSKYPYTPDGRFPGRWMSPFTIRCWRSPSRPR